MPDTTQDTSREDAERLRLHLLVLRCQAGDERAFETLFRQFEARTFAYLRGILGDEHTAEDAQQELWLSVFRNISALANPGAFRTWLFTSARHRALNWLRRRKREKELIVETPVEEMQLGAESDESAPFDIDRFVAAIAVLPPPQREVLLLRYRDDLSYAEIAVVTGAAIGTVRSRLHHAKRNLANS
jgi:RNA polymerase sigma-70 factor (ECF subfamily)